MRRAILLKSVQRVLGEGEQVRDAAYVWSRHRWVVPFGAVVLAGILLTAPVAGITDWPTRVVIALAGVGLAVTASTTYRVVAETDAGIVLCQASRIRQVATGVERRLGRNVEMKPIGGSLIAADWMVGDWTVTVPRSSQDAMARMAGIAPGAPGQ